MAIFAPLTVWTLLCCGQAGGSVESIGRITHEPISECSGIVASRKLQNAYWVHNDSGNNPVLYAIRSDGSLLGQFPVLATNLDWEDIATDSKNRLYVGDIGDNLGLLSVHAIYRFVAPNPLAKIKLPPLKIDGAFYFRYPGGQRFDAESLCIDGSRAWVIVKRKDHQEAGIFEISLARPNSILKPMTAKQVGLVPGFIEQVTGADLSLDGKRLAVCGYGIVRVYQRGANPLLKLTHRVTFEARGVEAICWSGNDLILASEDRQILKIVLDNSAK